MKKLVLFFVLICQLGQAQTSKESDSTATSNYERVYVEAGFVQPIGKLANKFEMSPSFGFWFRTKYIRNNFIDFGFNFFIPKNPVDVNFTYRDSVVQYKSERFAINIGARFASTVPLSSNPSELNLEWNSGFGMGINLYKAPEELEFDQGEHTEGILTTMYLSVGFKLNHKNIGLQCHYHFIPYGLLSEKMEKNYGSQMLLFGIVYRQ